MALSHSVKVLLVMHDDCNLQYTSREHKSTDGIFGGESGGGTICTDPGIPEHCDRTGSDFFIGGRLSFKCHSGFVLVGSEFRVCQSDGNFNGVQPVCKPATGEDHSKFIAHQ